MYIIISNYFISCACNLNINMNKYQRLVVPVSTVLYDVLYVL